LAQGASVSLGSFHVDIQNDGNLVLYGNEGWVWNTGTWGQSYSNCYLYFQPDGNLVVYNGSTALWTSQTYGNPSATLVLSSQFPQIQILSASSSVLWASTYQYGAGSFTLAQGQSLNLGSFHLDMQNDGNLVLYGNEGWVWNTGTGERAAGNCYLYFQPDGNLVVYNGSTALWNSQTYGNPGATLLLSSRFPQIQILSATGSVLWASTYQYGAGGFTLAQGQSLNLGSFHLDMQNDGNLVLYQGSSAIWNTGTWGQNCSNCYLYFQPDGNLVVYNGNTPLWNSGTAGNPDAKLVLSARSPQIQIVDGNGSAIWASSMPVITLSNTTHPGIAPAFEVGDTFQIAISNAPSNQTVSVSQTPGTTTQVGQTDANGNFTYTIVEQTSNIGSYTQVWSVGAVQLSPAISFMVGQLGTGGTISTTGMGQTSDGSVTGISTIAISNGTVNTYSATELDYTAQAYYDAYTIGTLYDEGQPVTSGQSYVTVGTADGTLSAAAKAWDDFTLQTDHYAVAFFISGGLYENPLYFGDGSCDDASSDCTMGPVNGAFWIEAATIYLGSTVADQTDVPDDGSSPLADDSFLDILPGAGPPSGNIKLKAQIWRQAIENVIPALFVAESTYSNQGQINTYPLPLFLELVKDMYDQPTPRPERVRTYIVRDTTGRHWVGGIDTSHPLTIKETLIKVGGQGVLPDAHDWRTSRNDIESNGAMDDIYQISPFSNYEVDEWQQYWATDYNPPTTLALPAIPGFPANTIPLMIKDYMNKCRPGMFSTQGIEIRSDYIGVNGDTGPGTACAN